MSVNSIIDQCGKVLPDNAPHTITHTNTQSHNHTHTHTHTHTHNHLQHIGDYSHTPVERDGTSKEQTLYLLQPFPVLNTHIENGTKYVQYTA